MAESNAFLAYGITVTAELLLYAVAAWPKLQGPFAFLDLVQLCRSKGMLRTAQRETGLHSVVERVPSEVWDVVRHNVVDLELREAELAHVRSLMCPDCHEEMRAEDLSWTDVFVGCEADGDELWRVFPGFAEEERLAAARNMLATFELAIPTRVPIRFGGGYNASFAQPEADPRRRRVRYSRKLRRGLWRCEQVILDVSLKVPPDATARFRRLVSQLHLQLVELTDGILANACSKKVQGKTKLRHDKRKCKEVPLAKIKPGWKLINMAKTTW